MNDKITTTCKITYDNTELIPIQCYIDKLTYIYNEYNDIYNTGYVKRIKNNINLLTALNNCIIDYDLSIIRKSEYDYLSYDIINDCTGEIVLIME